MCSLLRCGLSLYKNTEVEVRHEILAGGGVEGAGKGVASGASGLAGTVEEGEIGGAAGAKGGRSAVGAANGALCRGWLVCLVVAGHGNAPGSAELPEVNCRVAAQAVAAGIALVAVIGTAVASAVSRVRTGCVGPHGTGPVAESVGEGEGRRAEGAGGEGGAVEAANGAGGSSGEEVVKVAGQGLAVKGGGVEDPEVGGVARGTPPQGVAGGAVVGTGHAGQHRAVEVLSVVEDESRSTFVAVGG